MSSSLTLREYRDGDEHAIQQLYRTTFNRERPMDEWRWRFRQAPDGTALILVVDDAGEIVGHNAHVGFRTFVDRSLVRAGHGGDTMVRADRQGQGVLRQIAEGFLAHPHGYDLRVGFPTDEAARLWSRYGGAVHLGHLQRWIRCAGASSMGRCAGAAVPHWFRPIVRATHGPAGLLGRLPTRGVTIEPLDPGSSEVDELAERSAAFARCIRKRDSRYLAWRWFGQPGTDWSGLGARRRDGALAGWVVFGRDDRRPKKFVTGYVVDLLVEDAASMRLLLANAASKLGAAGCELIEFEFSDPREWAQRACRRAGFLRRGEGNNFICKALTPEVGHLVEDLDNWFLTKGDSDLA